MNLPVLRTLAIEPLDGGIAVLRVNRPDRMNAQTVTMFHEYGIAARALRDSGLRALILTGAGERAFCAGFDLDELDVITRFGVRGFLKFQETAASGITAIRHLPFPVIAAVHGAAVGGGLALALAADIRLAAPTAKFSAAFVRVGLSMGELGVSFTLSRLVGPGRAAEIGYTSRVVGATEAVRIGLANRVVPSERLFDEALAMATVIAAADAAARGGYMSGGGYGGQHSRPMGRGHLEHDVYPLDGSVSPRVLDSALTRSPAYTYKPTSS